MSGGAGFVLDASALLAYLLAEPGGEGVRDALAEQAAVMSAVNWAEVVDFRRRLHDRQKPSALKTLRLLIG